MNQLQLRVVTDAALGFTIAVPEDWEQMPPRVGTREVFSAMARPNGRTFVAVSKTLAKTSKLRDNVSLGEWVDDVVERLLNMDKSKALDMSRRSDKVGGVDAIRLDYRWEGGGESLTNRAYWMMRPPAAFSVVFGTFDPLADEEIIDQITATFALT